MLIAAAVFMCLLFQVVDCSVVSRAFSLADDSAHARRHLNASEEAPLWVLVIAVIMIVGVFTFIGNRCRRWCPGTSSGSDDDDDDSDNDGGGIFAFVFGGDSDGGGFFGGDGGGGDGGGGCDSGD